MRVNKHDMVLLPLLQPEYEVRLEVSDAILLRVVVWNPHLVQRLVQLAE
jgi:hypothetical protein